MFQAKFRTRFNPYNSRITHHNYYCGECCKITEEIFEKEGIHLTLFEGGLRIIEFVGVGDQVGGFTFIKYEYYENGKKKDFSILVMHNGLDIEISVKYDDVDSNILSKVVKKLNVLL